MSLVYSGWPWIPIMWFPIVNISTLVFSEFPTISAFNGTSHTSSWWHSIMVLVHHHLHHHHHHHHHHHLWRIIIDMKYYVILYLLCIYPILWEILLFLSMLYISPLITFLCQSKTCTCYISSISTRVFLFS